MLRDIVPEGSGVAGVEEHALIVQREVRRYFKKHDVEGRGLVTEERFRSFCRYRYYQIYLPSLICICGVYARMTCCTCH